MEIRPRRDIGRIWGTGKLEICNMPRRIPVPLERVLLAKGNSTHQGPRMEKKEGSHEKKDRISHRK